MPNSNTTFGFSSAARRRGGQAAPVERLTIVVDVCLAAVVLVAPYFMGGRHPVGQFVYVALAVAMAVAWCARQTLRDEGKYRPSGVELLLLGGVALVVLQLVALPAGILAVVSPATARYVPGLQGESGALAGWTQLSFNPAATRDGLVVLLAHGLVALVTIQRIKSLDDLERLLWLLAGGAVLMALVGLAQCFFGNGNFMWIYEHPFRTTDGVVKGAFINRNHFADFLALGVGPLVWCIARSLRETQQRQSHDRNLNRLRMRALLAGLGLATVLFAGLGSLSRGGAIALATALCTTALLLWLFRAVSLRFVGLLTLVGVVLGVSLFFYGYDQVEGRLSHLTEGSIDKLDQSRARRRIWEANWDALVDYHWLGTGVGTHADVYPIYLSQWLPNDYTHAESGYFQIGSSLGGAGLTLLAATLIFGGFVCAGTALRETDRDKLACLAALAGSLLASVVHSVVDFVWFIPACMSVTVLCAAAAVRLGMMSRSGGEPLIRVPRAAWGLTMFAVAGLGLWMLVDQSKPARASAEWDAYLRDDVALKQMTQAVQDGTSQWSPQSIAESTAQRRMSMVAHLQSVLKINPDDGRAHLNLAGAYLMRFEECQQASANAMTLSQVCDAAMASKFASRQELDAWLQRALGENAGYLEAALWHTRRGLSLCPLQGDGYIFLAQLSFLEGGDAQRRADCIAQALRVRPHSEAVLIGAAEEAWLRGDQAATLNYGKQAFHLGGHYRPVVVNLWAGRFPVAQLIEQLEPDLDDWPELYRAYRRLGQPDELCVLCQHFVRLAEQQGAAFSDVPAARLWSNVGEINLCLNQLAAAAECSRRACRCAPDDKQTRRFCGLALCAAGLYDEAEPHIRWCLQRMPDDAAMQNLARQAIAARLVAGAPQGMLPDASVRR